jgi:lysozyme family protein
MKRTLLFIILFLFSFIFLGFDKQKYPEHFINIMESVLLFEGGFTLIDFPEKTNMGIMQHTYDIYRTGKKLPHQSVEDITLDEVYDCYYINYYLPSGCDTLPPALSFVHFDIAVNGGPNKAKKLLLLTLNNQKITDSSDKPLALKYIDIRKKERYEIIKRHEEKRRFLKGWLNRDEKLRLIIEKYY